MTSTTRGYSQAAPSPGATLSKAVVRASASLKVSQSVLAEVLGISAPSASRLVSGSYQLEESRRKEWEMALLFVRLFRSLDAIEQRIHRAQPVDHVHLGLDVRKLADIGADDEAALLA